VRYPSALEMVTTRHYTNPRLADLTLHNQCDVQHTLTVLTLAM